MSTPESHVQTPSASGNVCPACSAAANAPVRWPCAVAVAAGSAALDRIAAYRGAANLRHLDRCLERLTVAQADTVRAHLVGSLLDRVDEFEFADLLDKAIDYAERTPATRAAR